MSTRREKRAIVDVPEPLHFANTPSLKPLSTLYYQSFMLMRDAANCEVERAPARFRFSRFVPPAVIVLHACADALMNEELGLSLAMMKSNAEYEEKYGPVLEQLMRRTLSSAQEKARRFAALYPPKRDFRADILDAFDLYTDFRDVLFHTEPQFLLANQFPAAVKNVCHRANVPASNQGWVDHASDIRVLEWCHSTVLAYFLERSQVTGAEDRLGGLVGGNRIEYHDNTTGKVTYSETMAVTWRKVRSTILPNFFKDDGGQVG